MNLVLKMAAACVGIGCLTAPTAQAATETYTNVANGPASCQAFTPGPSNTIRNRVLGSENVGSTAINVACNMINRTISTSGTANGTQLRVYFSNNNPSGTISVSCTMLTGFQTGTNKVASKTINVTAGSQSNMLFVPTDLDPSFSTLGNLLVGINCLIPPGGVINDMYYNYTEENGVGS